MAGPSHVSMMLGTWGTEFGEPLVFRWAIKPVGHSIVPDISVTLTTETVETPWYLKEVELGQVGTTCF